MCRKRPKGSSGPPEPRICVSPLDALRQLELVEDLELVEADLVDCIVACPGQLFYATTIPVCLWFLTRNKAAKGHRSRKGDARLEALGHRRLCLHARSLVFRHPQSGETIKVNAPLDEDFEAILAALRSDKR